jgi:hypothetical protein
MLLSKTLKIAVFRHFETDPDPRIHTSDQGFGSGSGSAWIRINLSLDPDPGGQKCPKKIEKRTEFSSFEVLDVLF